MGLFRISRGWQFEVCICAEPSVSPQSARAGEHFYRGEEEVGRAPTEFMGFHCLRLARKGEESLFFLLGAAVVVTSSIKVIRGFLLGTTWDLHSVVVMTALCLGGTLPCSEHH